VAQSVTTPEVGDFFSVVSALCSFGRGRLEKYGLLQPEKSNQTSDKNLSRHTHIFLASGFSRVRGLLIFVVALQLRRGSMTEKCRQMQIRPANHIATQTPAKRSKACIAALIRLDPKTMSFSRNRARSHACRKP